jgi:hypothetical protein
MVGDFSLIIGEKITPSYVAIFYNRRRRQANFFWIRFKPVDSNYDYVILPELTLDGLAQISVLEVSESTAVLVYRRLADYAGLYTRSLGLERLRLGAESLVQSDTPLLGGSNERLACRVAAGNDQIDCVMVVEGNKFTEIVMLASEVLKNPGHELEAAGSENGHHKVKDYILKVNSTKIYSHYLNSVCEQIDFSDKFIVLQVNFPVSAFFTELKRFMMVFRREPNRIHLYRGIVCKDYSLSCEKPINLIVGDSGRDFYLAVENDNNLVMNYTFLERRFMLPPKSDFGSANTSQYEVQVSNLFNPGDFFTAPLDTVVNFSPPSEDFFTRFSWLGAVLTLAPLWGLVIWAFVRDYKAKKHLKLYLEERPSERPTILKTLPMRRTEATDDTMGFQTHDNISLMDRTRYRDELRRHHLETAEEKQDEDEIRLRQITNLDTVSDV